MTLNLHDRVTVDGIDGLQKLIEGMIDTIRNPYFSQDAWMTTVEYLEQTHEQYFQYETGPDGQRWPELSDYTIQKKGHARILIDEERLIDSLTDSGSSEAIREYQPQTLVFGTKREWAWTHQEGTATLPQRMHTGLSEEGVDGVCEIMADAAVMLMFSFTG